MHRCICINGFEDAKQMGVNNVNILTAENQSLFLFQQNNATQAKAQPLKVLQRRCESNPSAKGTKPKSTNWCTCSKLFHCNSWIKSKEVCLEATSLFRIMLILPQFDSYSSCIGYDSLKINPNTRTKTGELKAPVGGSQNQLPHEVKEEKFIFFGVLVLLPVSIYIIIK